MPKQSNNKTESSLIMGNNKKKTLSKAQQTFNRLVKKIEKKQTELDKLTQKLDKDLRYYSNTLYPLIQEYDNAQKTLIEKLDIVHSDNKIKLTGIRKKLKTTIGIMLDEYLGESDTEPDDNLKRIYQKVFGTSYDEDIEMDMKEQFDNMKNQVHSMFQFAGFDVDVSELDHNMSQEELTAKMMEIEEQFKKENPDKFKEPKPRKKTKKQLEKEAKKKEIEAAKSKNISTIYKQLAKVLHPDLESDPVRKQEKEELMKEITTAYSNNDLHTLLRLELQFLHREENNIASMTDEKLAIYNNIMQEQVSDLENQIMDTLYHPQYHVLQEYANGPYAMQYLDLQRPFQKLQHEVKTTTKYLKDLDGNEATVLKTIQKIINEYEQTDDDFHSPTIVELINRMNQFQNFGGKRGW
ncbi:MAG: J domain-containing protein [Chitinophagaceae bacterium]